MPRLPQVSSPLQNNGQALPPHDSAAEKAALGCVLCAESVEALRCFDQLSAGDFYEFRNQELYGALNCLKLDHRPLDVIELRQWLKDKNRLEAAGGEAYVLSLPDQTPSAANFPTYLATLKNRTARRALLRDATEMAMLARNISVDTPSLIDIRKRALEAHGTAEKQKKSVLSGVGPDSVLSLTFTDDDCILGDRLLASGQSLVIVGAGSIGKSRLLLQLAVATITGRPWVSLETHGQHLRWLILQAENSTRRLQADLIALRNWVGPQDWVRVNNQLALHTIDTELDSFLSVGDPEVCRRITDLILATKPDAIVWDSLYNFSAGDLNSDQDMRDTLLTITRLSKTYSPQVAIVPVHHARTGKVGAAGVTGYDRSSFGRNSKVLHSWTRAQVNIAPATGDNNDVLVVSCGKCSNGREFQPFAIQLNPITMIYEPVPDFDVQAWASEVNGVETPLMNPARVAELCKPMSSKAELAKAIINDCGCVRQSAYRYILKAEKGHTIRFSKNSDTFSRV